MLTGGFKRKSSDINVSMSVAVYVSGISINNKSERYSEVVIIQQTK